MEFEDVIYEKRDGIAKITINRPEVYNAFRGKTTMELAEAFLDAWRDDSVGVVVLTGAGNKAFCSGGDQREDRTTSAYRPVGVDLFRIIRSIPKPVIAMVNGYAIGGGQVLHVACDLSIASENARFGQTGPKVGSFAGGWGTAYLARLVGERKAREIWFLCRQYTAQEALEMGLVNKVVPPEKLEEEVEVWCKEILALSPTALKVIKASFNADSDNIYGIYSLSHAALDLFYGTEEAREAQRAFLERRPPDVSKFRR